ncbi:Adaptor complexes medium subunit family [Handroanthus impetiginosus]|uniref:Adaptor complexes medium subunit family n=1 Tax=Handroanthus impetiginosus TaxID=429701 RepID=A0A2G9HUK2_9LAMI|nr:Adaptor complexes medium subunit family [Handroanthus impetiginosus]
MAGAASALFVLDIKGRCLISRDYRGAVSAGQVEKFFSKLLEKEGDIESHGPICYDNGVSYMFIQHNNIYLMTASRTNCNAASLLLFLHHVVDVFKHYFEKLEEESLRDNFVVVYELLDEIMDFGYPQYTEAKILSEFIKTDAYRMEVAQRPPMAVTNAVSWRSEGIFYRTNEVFLDVVESVNILVNSNGQIIRSEVNGALKMRTCLSGMPECKLGLNDRVLLEAQDRSTKGKVIDLDDVKFHQCVRLARFENDRTISFIPPDGSFDLMTYRLSTQVKPLIWVEAQVERYARSRVEMMVKARSQFKERSTATNVAIELPVPSDATNPDIRTSVGSAKYAPEKDAILIGMPECKLGLNDRVLLEAQDRSTKGKVIDLDDVKFHQCVRLARFENDRTISFIPPDGSFDLMTYRLSTQVKPLIWVEAQVERYARSRVEMMVKARSQFKERSTATNVTIELPVPSDATNPDIRTSVGSAKYAPEKDAILWKIKSFPGNKEYLLRAEFKLPSIVSEDVDPDRKAPISVKFEIPYFTVSGIQVRYLKIIEKSGYQALPWVRYITMAGDYELRLI